MKTSGVILTVLMIAVLASCCSSKAGQLDESNQPAADGKLKLAELDSSLPADSVIVLEGKYMGIYGKDCKMIEGSRQQTRSDWIFTDGQQCIYVSGGGPKNLHPMNDKNIDILLKAKYKHKDGAVYLEYVESKLIKQ